MQPGSAYFDFSETQDALPVRLGTLTGHTLKDEPGMCLVKRLSDE